MKLKSMIFILVLWISYTTITNAQPSLRNGIIISEVLPDPSGTSNYDTDRNGSFDSTDEFVEVYNSHSDEVSLAGLELWDPSKDKWYTFPDTSLAAGAYAVVMTGLGTGGILQEPYLYNLAFSAASGSAILNNGGDNIILYDPDADQYVQAVYNGATIIEPVTTMVGFSPTATRIGFTEDFGTDSDGISIVREPIDASSFKLQTEVYSKWNASPGNPSYPEPGYWKLTANSVEWSETSNWDDESIPSSSDLVVIRQTCSNFPKISSSAEISSLVMYPASNLTVKNGGKLNLNDLACAGKPEYMSSLVDENPNGTGINIDNKFYYATELPGNRWWYLSPPVSDGTSEAIEPSKSTNFLFHWNEVNLNHGWNEITDNNTSLIAAKGYAAYFEKSKETPVFEGTLNNGTMTINFTRTSGVTHAGFNLTGNPFPSYLDWGKENDGSGDEMVTKNNIEPTIWYRTNGQYATYNRAIGIGVNGGTRYIPPLQAFWTRVCDGKITGCMQVSNLMCSHQENSLLKKIDIPESREVIRFFLNSGDYSDEIALIVSPKAEIGFDNEDSEKFYFQNDEAPYVYFYSNGKKLAINSIPMDHNNMSIPIILNNKKNNECSLKTSRINLINPNLEIFLEDKVKKELYDLRVHDNYKFSMNTNNQEASRFILHLFYEPSSISKKFSPVEKIRIFQSGEKLVIQPSLSGIVIKDLKIYDITGKTIFYSPETFSTSQSFAPQLSRGVYITHVTVNGVKEAYRIVIR